MGECADDALDVELEIWMNECEFGEDYELDWPENDGLGCSIPTFKKRQST